MKRPAANFAVEYKNSRRKAASPASSIWGKLDLKLVASQIEDERFAFDQDVARGADGNNVPPGSEPSAPSLTSAPDPVTTTSVAQEGPMADENNVTSELDTETADVLPTETEEPKKRRGPRKKASAETSGDDSALSGAAKPAGKRGRPKGAARGKAGTGAGRAKGPAPVGEVSAPADTPADISAPTDEMEDLLQLEQENQRLRKLLAEKLREENMTLRKRLGLD